MLLKGARCPVGAQPTWHLALKQTWPCGHTMPHEAQLLASLLRLTSQPLAGLLSQLANPARHWLSTHTLLMHCELALGKLHCWQVQPPLMQTRPCGHWLP